MLYLLYLASLLLVIHPALSEQYENVFDNNNVYQETTVASNAIVDEEIKTVNQPPFLNHRVQRLSATAGKVFRYVIPIDTFNDPEEGSNLTFNMYDSENNPLGLDSWIQFNSTERKIYGLPLDIHVSRWNFIIEAEDSEGLVARCPLDIRVRQPRNHRNINHNFVTKGKLLKLFKTSIEWQIIFLEDLMSHIRDTTIDQLSVVNATQNGDLYELTWLNDSLLRYSSCPIDDINRNMQITKSVMNPDIEVLEVHWVPMGRCVERLVPKIDTFPPISRNQIDHITATVGHLFVYKVFGDTFYDPQDGNTENLKLSLKLSDGSEIPSSHWLQFDAHKQEFYGLPKPSDERSVQYMLIAENSFNQSTFDSFTLEVKKPPYFCPTVEFHVTLDPSVNLMNNARNQRNIIEKLARLFAQNETNNIRISTIIDNPTTIIWYLTNSPSKIMVETEELRKIITMTAFNDGQGDINKKDDQIFKTDLKIKSVHLIPVGFCTDQSSETTQSSNNIN